MQVYGVGCRLHPLVVVAPELVIGPIVREEDLCHLHRKVDIRLLGKGHSRFPWRKAGQPGHLVDVVDSDQ